ncbi:MAG: hypothetical protein HN919_07630 [Verrucomicrobia bacterium]|jgi:hypothetical protein|nr:hypothetical protein [Verrucomicrobiota bacterium]MBT7066158.1 hypothetical protein [Verrucomicrobiota bacterium]MBT7699420.1 hypothetical protein [Verrucomicrobiota bacterium]
MNKTADILLRRAPLLVVLWLLGAAATARADSASDGTVPIGNRVDRIVRELGANQFAVRHAAEAKLLTQSRAALPALMRHRDSDDPEVRERVRRIIQQIKMNPATVPEAIFAFDKDPQFTSFTKMRVYWDAQMKAWQADAQVTTKNDDPETSATGGSFYQSFVPHTNRIAAIAVQVYSFYDKEGWLAVDVYEDVAGKPSDYVLTRAFLKTQKRGPASPHVFIVFDVPDIDVTPGQPHWFRFRDLSKITNHGLTIKRDAYPEGRYMHVDQRSETDRTSARDAKFRIIASCGPVPLLHAATEEEQASLQSLRSVPGGNRH